MNYPNDMDRPCIPICDAINSVPGLITYASCSGHGKGPLRVWFTVSKLRNLYVLLKNVDKRYIGFDGWSCDIQNTDTINLPVVFSVTSGTTVGKPAYAQSKIIAKCMLSFLDNKKFMRMWKIK